MTSASNVPPVGWNAIDHVREQRRLQQAQAFEYSVQTNAESFAHAAQIARKSGQPLDQVLQDPKAAEAVLQQRMIESQEFRQQFPVLSKSLEDVNFLAMVRDDLGNLQTTEGALDWATRSWRVARNTSRRGTIGTMAGLAGRGLTVWERREVARMDELAQAHAERDAGFTGAAIELLGSMVDTVGSAVTAGAATTAVGAPAAAPFTAGAAAFAQSMRLEAGNLYVDLIQQGYTPAEAQPIAGLFGAAIGAVDVVGLKFAAKPFKETAGALLPKVFARGLTPQTRTLAFKEALKAYGTALVAEPGTEALQEVIAMAGKEMARVSYTDDTESQFDMGQAVDAFTHTLKGMVVLGGLGAGGHYVADMRRAANAKHNQRVFQAQAEARADSKVAKRDPDTRAAFINEKVADTPIETVFIRGDKAAEVLRQAEAAEAEETGRSSVMESLEQLMPGLSAQIAEAADTGGDVAISNGDFDAKLAETPIGQALMEHATFDADGMTAHEAQMWESQRQAEADHYREQSAENMERDRALADSAREVEDIVYTGLRDTGVLNSRDARASAQFYRDFVVTQAADLNVSPKEFYDRYPLKVGRGESTRPEAAFNQANTDTPEFRAWFGDSKIVGEDGAPLVVYHGTPTPGFDAFDPERRASNIAARDSKEGFFFTPDASLASEFVWRDGEQTGGVMPMYMRMENPAMLTETFDPSDLSRFADVLREARESGHDGVAAWFEWLGHRSPVYVVFDANQVKSVNNRGSFSRADTGVLRQDSDSAQPTTKTLKAETILRLAGGRSTRQYDEAMRRVLESNGMQGWGAWLSSSFRTHEVYEDIVSYTGIHPEAVRTAKERAGIDLETPDEELWDGVDASTILRLYGFASELDKVVADPLNPGRERVAAREQVLQEAALLLDGLDPMLDVETGDVTFVLDERNDQGGVRQDEEEDGQAPRGEFLPHALTILLGEKADATTFLHESAHYFLTVYSDLAAQPDAPSRVQSDMGKLLQSFGVESVEAWNAMSLEEQREHHEAFAYNFEQYLFDGKAPSAELAPLFQRFAAWLRRVYRGIRGELNRIYRREFGKDLPILTGEVRGVMDRMLATEEQIGGAEHARGLVPLFQTQEESGMSDAEWEDYQENAGRAHDEAINDLAGKSLADMKWLSNARAKALREKQAEVADTRAAVRAEVKAEIEQEPIYRAMHYLKRGEVRASDGSAQAVEGAHKLDNETVQRMLGKPDKKPRRSRKSLATFVREKGGIAHSSWTKTYPGETKGEFRIGGVFRGKPKATAARGTTGMPWEQMAVLARENGYGPEIVADESLENDDHTWFIEALADAANGNHTYTNEARTEDAIAQSEREDATRQQLLKQLGYGKYGMLQNEGLDPDRVAEAYGFPTGRALVDALLAARPINEAIDAATDVRMLQEHGDLVDPSQIALAVEGAVHNEARARFVTTELKALAKITQPTRLMTEAAKEAARQILAKKSIRDIRPRDFSIAEARHAREAFRALQDGDTAAAIVAKQKQLVQFHLAKQAAEVQLEVQKTNKDFRRVFKSDAQLAKTRDVNVVQAARAVLTLYDLGQASRTPMEWLKPVEEYDPLTFADIAADVQFAIDQSARLDPGKTQVPAKWKGLTLEQYRELRETIDALWHKSRRTKQVLLDGKRQSRDAVAARAIEQLESLPAKKRLAGGRGAADEAKDGARSYVAQAKRAEFVLRDLDGGKPGVFTSLFQRIKEAANAFREEARTELQTYEDRLREHNWGPDEKIDGSRWLFEGNERAKHSGVFKNKAELLGVMQHLGNESNKKKALVSEGWAELREDKSIDASVWEAFEREMVRTGVLVKADYDLLQAIWDQNESHKSALQKAHYENHGYHWKEIEPQTMLVTFPDGTEARYRGGYVPAKADKKRVPLAARQEIDTKAAVQSSLPMVQRGFTKERSESYIEPLSHDLNETGRHLIEVLRYVHMQGAATDVNRILSHRDVANALQAYDPALLPDVFTPWLKRAAVQQVGEIDGNPAFRLVARIASNTNMGIMFANVGNSLQNFTGLAEAMTAAKPKHVLGALASYVMPGKRKQMREAALEKSSELRGRQGRQMVEVRNEIRRQIAGAGKVRRALDWVRENAYFMQQITQNVVDTIVWTASYNQTLAAGKDELQAIRAGDSAVRRTQMATDPEDVSEWEAQGSGAGGFVRALFPFQSWFIRWANNQVSNWKNAEEAGGRMAAMIYGYALPLILAQIVSDAVNGRLEDEDDDGWGDEAGELAVRSLVGGSLAAVPMFGKPITSLANTWLDDEVWNDRMPAPPFVEAFERARRAIASDDFETRDAEDLLSFFGNAVGLPIGALVSRFTYGYRVQQGDVEPSGALDLVRGLVTGRGR